MPCLNVKIINRYNNNVIKDVNVLLDDSITQVKNKLLEDVNFAKYSQKTPKSLQHTIDEFSSGLADYLNTKSNNDTTTKLPIKINNSFLKFSINKFLIIFFNN